MLGNIGTSDTTQTGPRCPCTPQIAFYPRIGRVFFTFTKLKSAYNLLIIGRTGLGCQTSL